MFFSFDRELPQRFPEFDKNNDRMGGRATLIQVNVTGVRPDPAAFAGWNSQASAAPSAPRA